MSVADFLYSRALVSPPPACFAGGLSSQPDAAPDIDIARQQHAVYVETLRRLGLEIVVLPPDERYPDGCFVEDTAVITPHFAVITYPGAPSRQGETARMPEWLGRWRPLLFITPPATLEGGDVLRIGRHFFIGLSERTNEEGAARLRSIAYDHGYTAEMVEVGPDLHLKTCVSWAGDDRLILTRSFAQKPAFEPFRHLIVEPEEAYAANCVYINGHLLVPAGFPGLCGQLQQAGLPFTELDMSEFRQMDGGLTCLSLLL